MNFVPTTYALEARAMCQSVLDAPKYSRLGQIIGDPGTGKSATTEWLAAELGAIRIEAWDGMKGKTLLQELARAMNGAGIVVDETGTANTLTQRIVRSPIEGRLIFVDEANHLPWRSLELLRGVSDIGGAGLVIAGTDILAKKFIHPQIRVYLEQFRQRIGTKRVTMKPLTDESELATHILAPRFDQVTRTAAKSFLKHTGGNWRFAVALADACARLMANEGIEKLDAQVVDTAAEWLAGSD